MAGKNGKREKIYQQITDQVVHYIRSGTLKPGDKLPALSDMAHDFGVSRAAMREAFSALQGMGLVSMRHGEGTFVAKLDLQMDVLEPMNAALLLGMGDLKQLHQVRKILEVAACRLAAEHHSAEELQEISSALWGIEMSDSHSEAFATVDWRYHLAIAAASHNSILLNLLSTLSASMQSVTMWIENENLTEDRLDWYQKIYESIQARDAVRAGMNMENYLDSIWFIFTQNKGE